MTSFAMVTFVVFIVLIIVAFTLVLLLNHLGEEFLHIVFGHILVLHHAHHLLLHHVHVAFIVTAFFTSLDELGLFGDSGLLGNSGLSFLLRGLALGLLATFLTFTRLLAGLLLSLAAFLSGSFLGFVAR